MVSTANLHPYVAVAVCCSGGEAAMTEVLHCVRHGWPLVVVKGSGGVADAIAFACAPENRHVFVPNPKLMEIAREGKVGMCNRL